MWIGQSNKAHTAWRRCSLLSCCLCTLGHREVLPLCV